MNGLQFQKHIDQDPELKGKSIPLIFLSGIHNPQIIEEAYKSTIQGFFLKPYTQEDMVECFKEIISYWTKCLHPKAVKKL